MRSAIPYFLIVLIPSIIILFLLSNKKNAENFSRLHFDTTATHQPSVDHTKLEILQGEFESANDVTAACLSCHTERDKEIMATSHWKWERSEELPGKGIVPLGKKNILNNFCIGVSGSEGTCTRCHIGYGYSDKNFDFNEPTNIDCLVCHDNSGTYKKAKGAAGYPDKSVDLSYVAQNVGRPGKANCGVCHFWGGGGNGVKHGDMDITLLDCQKDVDIHMASDGVNLECVDCHTTEKHQMSGKLYAVSSENKNRATCTKCHSQKPHADELLNDHNIRVACQTCHIPVYAKGNSTKMIWDWSTAGQMGEDGKPTHFNDADGNHSYLTIKGDFVWDDHVIPDYYWFNGTANHQLITDKIDTSAGPVQMNTLYGSYREKSENGKYSSKIWPVKVHRGKQIYDSKYLTLIQPKLWDKEAGKGAYWKDFDWNIANQKGMEYLGLPYSGEYGFIETEMYWPLNHMVSAKENSLTCKDCHARENGRLASLNDFYLPGRDRMAAVNNIGIAVIILSIIAVIIHLIFRIIYGKTCWLDTSKNKKIQS